MAVRCVKCKAEFEKNHYRCLECGSRTKRLPEKKNKLVIFKQVEDEQPVLPPYLAG
jgi:hypothetical protein